LRLADGLWIPIVVGPRDGRDAWPQCHVILGGRWEDADVHTMFSREVRVASWPRLFFRLHQDCILRWPSREERTLT
jgi:hypothetical protein